MEVKKERTFKGKPISYYHVETFCEECGKPMIVPRHDISRGKGKFCSRSCMGKAQSKDRSGSGSSSWIGGRVVINGYVHVREGKWYVREHRKIIEEAMGQPLRSDELVHHVNGNKTDNDPDNLTVMDWASHQAFHRSQQATNRCDRWSRDRDSCRECGTKERPHMAHGLCRNCYERGRKQRNNH